jgi:hypothetical protein
MDAPGPLHYAGGTTTVSALSHRDHREVSNFAPRRPGGHREEVSGKRNHALTFAESDLKSK